MIVSEFEQNKCQRSRGGIRNTIELTEARNESFELASGHLHVSRFGMAASSHEMDTLQTLTTMRLRWSRLLSKRFYAFAAHLLAAIIAI